MRPLRVVSILLLLLAVIVACTRPTTLLPAPEITGVTPVGGPATGGAEVTITGSGFFQVESGQFAHSLAVTVCGVQLQDVRVNGVLRRIVLPGGASASITHGNTITGLTGPGELDASGDITVRLPDGQSVTLAGAFNCYDEQPQITAFSASPASAVIGQLVTFSWEIYNPAGADLTCSLDYGGGPVPLADCPETGTVVHTYATAGMHDTLFTVAGGGADPVQAAASVQVVAQMPAAVDDHYLVTGGRAFSVPAPGVLGNDTPFDASLIGPAVSSQGGTVQLAVDGSFSYDAPAGFSGTDSFTYSLTNASGLVEATVSLEVRLVPSAQDDAYATGLDAELVVPAAGGVLANDSGDPAPAVSGWEAAANGTVSGNPDGSFSYLPDSGFTGTDQFGYTISNTAGSAAASVTVVVGQVPHALDDEYTTLRDTPLAIPAAGLLANDQMQGASLSHDTVSSGGGTVLVQQDGSFTYAPATGYTGQDEFSYTLTNALGSSSAVVRVNVYATPVAANDDYTTGMDVPLLVPAPGLLANDSGVPAPVAVAFSGVTSQGGTLTIHPDGEVDYSPASGFTGIDSFSYSIANTAGTDIATVLITVGSLPLAEDDTALGLFGQALDIPLAELLANDSVNGGALSLTGLLSSQGGTVSLTGGTVSYVPAAGFSGEDTFQYRLSNGLGDSTATVHVSVRRAPAVVDDSYAAVAGKALSIAAPGVLANDSGYPALTAVPQADLRTSLGGTVSLNADGSFHYQPPAATGTDSFDYSASNVLGTFTATVSIDVRLWPVALADSYSTGVDTVLNVAAPGLLHNDIGVPAPAVTPGIWLSANGSRLTLSADGSFTYAPWAGFIGVDTFDYQISNSAGAAYGLAEFTVGSLPVGTADNYPAFVNTTLSVPAPGVLFNDTLNGAALLPLTGHQTTLGGQIDLQADGSFTYQPPTGIAGADSFEYSLHNGLGTVPVPVTVQVDWAGPPVAVDDNFATPAGTALEVAAPGVLGNDAHNHAPVAGFDAVSVQGGMVNIDPAGAFSYTPAAGYSGPDSFTYLLQNVLGNSSATVYVDVTAAARAVADQFQTAIGADLTDNVLNNDEGWPRPTAVLQSPPAQGTATLNSDGTMTYRPAAGFVGMDSFDYQAVDALDNRTTATVSIKVGAAPAADDDAYEIEQAAIPALLASVLDNDDRQLAAFTATSLTGDQDGTIVLEPDGQFSYTPGAGWLGEELFSYSLSNVFSSASAQISIFVYQQVVAAADSFSTAFAAPITVSPLLNASGFPLPEILSLDDSATNGTVSLDPATGEVTYTPQAGFVGVDSFSYLAGNGYGTDVTATAQITVGRAPEAVADELVVPGHSTSSIDTAVLLANDTFDGAPVITADTTGLVGSLSGWDYTPAPGFSGIDTFSYTLSNDLGSSTADVRLVINGPPVPADDDYSTALNTNLTVPAATGVLENDGGYPAPTVTVQTATDTHGNRLVMAADGSFTFEPTAGFTGTALFDYEAVNAGGSAEANVRVAVGNPASATDDNLGTVLGNVPGVLLSGADPFSPLGNDTGDLIVLDGVAGSSSEGGTVTLNPDGSLLYLPPAGYTGADSFSYTISNGFGPSTGTVNLTVAGMIWFVNAAATVAGDGRLDSPFATVAELTDLDDGHAVFLHEGAYSGAVKLKPGVRLIGEGATGDLASLAGLTWPSGTAMPVLLGPDGGLVTLLLGADSLELATDNQLHGLTISGAAAGKPVLQGAGFGTLTVSGVRLSATGRDALLLAGGTLAAEFLEISSSGGTAPVDLSQVGGSLAVLSGNLSTVDEAGVSERCFRVRAFGTISLNLHLQALAFQECDYGLDVVTAETGSARLNLKQLDVDVRGGGINLAAVDNSAIEVHLLDSHLHNTVADNVAVGYWAVSTGRARVVSQIENSTFTGSHLPVYAVAREGSGARTELTLLGSTLTAGSDFPMAGLRVAAGNGSPGESTSACLNAQGNTMTANGFGALGGIYIEQFAGNSLRVPGYNGSGSSASELAAYLASANNEATVLVDNYLQANGGVPCQTPGVTGGN